LYEQDRLPLAMALSVEKGVLENAVDPGTPLRGVQLVQER
jgi:hypothetical protein